MRPSAVSPRFWRVSHEVVCRDLTISSLCNPDEDLPLWSACTGKVPGHANGRDTNPLGEPRGRKLFCLQVVSEFHDGDATKPVLPSQGIADMVLDRGRGSE